MRYFNAWIRNHFFEVIEGVLRYSSVYLEKYITPPGGPREKYSYIFWNANKIDVWTVSLDRCGI